MVKNFDSLDSYWAFCLNNSSPSHIAKILKFRKDIDECALLAAHAYNLPAQYTENIGFVFNSVTETRRRIKEPETVYMLCNLSNPLVIQYTVAPNNIYTVATVHKDVDFEILTTLQTPAVVAAPKYED